MTPTSYGSTTDPNPTEPTEPTPTEGSYGEGSYGDVDLPDGPFKDWPGAGPTPDAEEEGFRQKILDIIEARRKRDREEYEQRCEEAKGFYGGTGEQPDPNQPDPNEPYDPDQPEPDPNEPDPNQPYDPNDPNPTGPTSPTYGSTTPTPGGTTTGYSTSS